MIDESVPELGNSVLDDQTLLQKAKNAENSRKFTVLFEEGWDAEVVQRVYERRRCAELALVTLLLWWSRHDENQVRRLFERSALSQGDWNEYPQYYREYISAARDLIGTEHYNPEYPVQDE